MLNYPPARESNRQSPAMPRSERNLISRQPSDTLKVPPADSPYGRAKHVQLVEKDPNRAISMFWAALNLGDRVESSLKDMAIVMKQVNISDEAIEAIKSFRHLCSVESQESLDNILLELYKRCGKIEEQIEMLEVKLKHIEEGLAFDGRRMKAARSNGKKIQITIEQEYSRMLGNLAWAYLQQDKYKSAEELYRKALSLEKDKNKQCNLAICLMYMERMIEAKFLLECVRSSGNGLMEKTHAKSLGRASEILVELESQSCEETKKPFSSLIKRDAEEYPISGNLSEDKMTDANDHETVQQKRVSSCSWNGCKTSSSNVESSKCAPFGQRIGLQSSHKTSFAGKLNRGESYVRNYYEGRTGFGSKWNGNLERVAGGEMGYDTLSVNPAGGSPVVLFTQPRRGSPYSFGNAASGCNRKLTFAGNREQGRNSGSLESSRDEEYGTESGNCKELQSQCKPIKETLEARKHFSFDSSNKSWADMVAQAEYFDENTNCNIYFGSLLPQNQTESLSKKNGVLGFER